MSKKFVIQDSDIPTKLCLEQGTDCVRLMASNKDFRLCLMEFRNGKFKRQDINSTSIAESLGIETEGADDHPLVIEESQI